MRTTILLNVLSTWLFLVRVNQHLSIRRLHVTIMHLFLHAHVQQARKALKAWFYLTCISVQVWNSESETNQKLNQSVHVFSILDFITPSYKVCPPNQTNITEPGQRTAAVSWSDPIATDNSNQEPETTCDPKSGTKFPIGQSKVHCTAEDKSGNKAECNFFVDVKGKKKIKQNKIQVIDFVIYFIIQPPYSHKFNRKVIKIFTYSLPVTS